MKRRTEQPAISVRLQHTQSGQSISFTINPLGLSLESIARVLNDEARRRWSATDINSRRHRRR